MSHRLRRRAIVLLSLLSSLSLLSLMLALNSGSVDISVSTLIQLLLGDVESVSSFEYQVIYQLRLPRATSALVVGGMLALSGVIMQVLLRNPLADPYILGISGGAAVAALTTILLGLSSVWTSNAAFVAALLSMFLVFSIANSAGSWSTTRLLLTGIVVSAGWGAIINILLTTSSTNTVQSMLFWLMGDLSQSNVSYLHGVLLIAGGVSALLMSRSLNILVRGDEVALAYGVNVRALRLSLYVIASLLTASAVTVAGSVGFVGLIIPHILRLAGARDHRLLIPSSILLGGAFLLIADSLSRTLIAPQQLPVGVVTALIGVPVFIIILRSAFATTSNR